MMLKIPPRIKILEALGSIADNRIARVGAGVYEVVSSMGDRKYTVKIEENRVSSNDNGTRFKGYIGYPIVAALILEGKLPYQDNVTQLLRGIKWKELNEREKNYRKVEEVVRELVVERGGDWKDVEMLVSRIIEELGFLSLEAGDL